MNHVKFRPCECVWTGIRYKLGSIFQNQQLQPSCPALSILQHIRHIKHIKHHTAGIVHSVPPPPLQRHTFEFLPPGYNFRMKWRNGTSGPQFGPSFFNPPPQGVGRVGLVKETL